MRVGLYFGSFNPIHTGHLIIANHILNETRLKKIWFVLSPQNPFKPSATLLNEYDRLYLVNKAIENDPRLKGSDIEFSLPRPSYTAVTLSHLKDKHPDFEFTVVMGSDSFRNIEKWKNFEYITKNYPIVIYKRPGFEIENNVGAGISVMNAPLLEISATYVRELLKDGKSVKYLVPESIEQELMGNAFFKKSKKVP